MTKYRPDVDGLRAVAVISVLLYHLGVERFSGGFVGVDVFFVISGFLITKLIITEVEETSRFSFARFYERRVRRLFPALLAVVTISFIVAAVLFTAKHFSELAGSSLAAIVSLSNVYFWLQSGYFDTDAIFKPLLHTWSLSVEEQFYLVWPPTLVFLLVKFGRRPAAVTLAALFTTSLAANWIFAPGVHSPVLTERFADGGSTIFYLMPFRIFELAIGAGLVWFGRTRFNSNLVHEVGLLVGLSLIVCAALTFTKSMTFPSTAALVPCVGAALVILCGGARYFGILLRNRMCVGIGLISYSLYLVHWPLIVFYHYLTLRPPTNHEKIGILLASIVLATASYFFIEQPFRRRESRFWRPARQFVPACITLAAVVSATSVSAFDGWTWRAPVPSPLSAYGGDGCAKPRCSHGYDGEPVYVLGESFSRQLYDGLITEFPRQKFIVFDVGDCTIFSPKWVRWEEAEGEVQHCTSFREKLFSEIKGKHAKIIFANNWIRDKYFDADEYRATGNIKIARLSTYEEKASFTFSEIEKLKVSLGLSDVLVMGNPPSVGDLPDLDLCVNRPVHFGETECDVTPLADVAPRRYLADAAPSGIKTLDPFAAFCDASGCANFGPRGQLYSDRFHLSKLGSRKLIGYFKSDIANWIGRVTTVRRDHAHQ